MALSMELERRLRDDGEPLSKRLRLAKNSFLHTELFINKKEESVLKWLLEEEANTESSSQVWRTVLECLSSNRMLNLPASEIRTSEKAKLITVLGDSLDKILPSDGNYRTLVECILHVLENPHFHQYFRKQLQDYVNLNRVFLRGVTHLQDAQLFLRGLSCLVSFHKLLPRQDELSELFVAELMVALVESCSELEKEIVQLGDAQKIPQKVVQCIERLVFPRSKLPDVRDCISAVLSPSDSSSGSPSVLGRLFALLSTATSSLPETTASNVYHIVFQAFVHSYAKEDAAICGMFIILCHFLGFRSGHLAHRNFKAVFRDKIPKSQKATATSLGILKRLLEVSSTNNVKFGDRLDALVSSVLKVKVCSSTFDVLSAIIQLNPLIIEAKINSILEFIFLVDEDFSGLRASYSSFLLGVLTMFNKLHRLQKFTTKFLSTTLDCCVRSDSEGLELRISSSDIFPREVCREFCASMATLPGSQCTDMMKSLTYHVNQDCVAGLDRGLCGEGFLLYVEVLADVVCHFLDGVRMADHSLPGVVVDKFIAAMMEMREALGRVGTALLNREHCRRLMVSFLRMCHSCGELQILLLHYSPRWESNESLQVTASSNDHSATNLEYLHSYLSSEQWNLVGQRIKNFGEDACKEMLNKLILQKLRSAALFGDDTSELSSPVTKHILDHIAETWPLLLGPNMSLLMPLLTPDQRRQVAALLVEKLVSSEELRHTLQSPAIQDNRPLATLLALAVISSISKLFSKRKRKLDHEQPAPQLARRVLSAVSEGSDGDDLIPQLAAVIDEACSSYDHTTVTNGFTLDASSLESYLRLLRSLPILFLSLETRTLLLFCVLAMAVSLRVADKLATVKEQLAELMLVLLEGPNSPNLAAHLHLGHLMSCLPELGLAQPLVLQQLFNMCLRQEGGLGRLEEAASVLNTSDLRHDTLLLGCVVKVKKALIPKEDRVSFVKLKKKLSRTIIRYVKHHGCEPTREMLEGFSLALQVYVAGSKKSLNKVTSYLDSFIQAALSSLTGSTEPCPAAIMLLGTVLTHKSMLAEYLPADFTSQVWSVLSTEQRVVCAASQLSKLLEVTTDDEFHKIVESLLSETRSSQVLEPTLLRLWRCVALSSVNKTKAAVREDALHDACLHVVSLLSVTSTISDVVQLLELALTLAKRRLVKPSAPLLDLFLETIALLPTDQPPPLPDMVSATNLSLELMTTLLLHWTVLILPRIPLFLQCFRRLVTWLAAQSSVGRGLNEREVSQLAGCAHGIERLANAIVKQKKDFAPVSAFVIADILYQFEKYTIYPAVKTHLTNTSYILLQLCDKHALAHLFRALPAGSRELFSTVYRNYKKYYRFTGKV